MPLFKHGKDKSSSHAPKEKQTTPGPTRSDPEPQSFNPDVPSLVTPKQNVSNVEAASSKAQNPDTRRPGVSIPDSRRVDARTNSALGVEGLVEDINNSTNFDFGLKTPTTHENLTAQGAIGVGRQQLSSSDTEGIDPPGRRDNPTNAMRKTLTKAPTSSLHDSYKILARLSDGTPLYRLCEIVPYILGPAEYLAAIRRTFDYSSLPEGVLDGFGVSNEDELDTSDKALMLMLILLRIPEESRESSTEYVLQGTQTQKNRLVVWKHVGPSEPIAIGVTMEEFVDYYHEWTRYPNTMKISNDRPDVNTPWSETVERLLALNIDVELIDARLYLALTTTPTGEEFDKLFITIQKEAESGALAARKEQFVRTRERTHTAPPSSTSFTKNKDEEQTTFSYVQPASRDRSQLYSVRFSHQNPEGEMQVAGDDANREEDEYFAMCEGAAITRHKHSVGHGIEILKEKKNIWGATMAAKVLRITCCVFLVFGVMAAILMILYFRVIKSGKNDF